MDYEGNFVLLILGKILCMTKDSKSCNIGCTMSVVLVHQSSTWVRNRCINSVGQKQMYQFGGSETDVSIRWIRNRCISSVDQEVGVRSKVTTCHSPTRLSRLILSMARRYARRTSSSVTTSLIRFHFSGLSNHW